MSKTVLYKKLAGLVIAYQNTLKAGNGEWQERHRAAGDWLCKEHLPSGSGFDNGTKLNWERSSPECLFFGTSFHHMDESGGYDGWTHHHVRVRASLAFGIAIMVDGKNRNDIKDVIHEAFEVALKQEIDLPVGVG